ncbi:MAG TPA: TetR family transcriptional regulator [Burkholderiales bacterium]|nr:TetR family transcriptional regulator [Burkholderiales bacterium]
MTASQMRRRRAVAPHEKVERRAAIVDAVHELARRDLSASYSVEQLARKAGVAKGTVYLYFKTREEMLLAVHEKHAHELFDVVERALAAPAASARKVVRAGLRYLKAHPEFYPLAAGCRGMLDRNVSTEAAFAFKVSLGRRLEPLGARIEQLYPGLRRGEGAVLLMNSYAMIVGLWQLADPPLSLRPVMNRPEMQLFKLDFERQLTAALLDLWEAAARRKP